MDRVGRATAPGKIILSGEHSVVYGYPALVSAISLRCMAEANFLPEPGIEIISKDLGVRQVYSADEVLQLKDISLNPKTDNLAYAVYKTLEYLGLGPQKEEGISISLKSEIPISAGLGSSAASAVACVGSVLSLLEKELEKEQISQLAFEGEILAHGTPSGVDNAAATFGGFLRYEQGHIQKLDLTSKIPIIIVNTQVPRETKSLVAAVRSRFEENEPIMGDIFEAMGKIPEAMIEAIYSNDLRKIGQLMEINQGLLDTIGVGHRSLTEMIWTAKEYGAYGAKLTGAGGGGCGIILPKDEETGSKIIESLSEKKFNTFKTQVSQEGVLIER